MKKLIFIVTAAAVIVLGFIVFPGLMSQGNRFVEIDQRVDKSVQLWQSQLQRRADLLPNLANTAAAGAAHEKDTQEAVARARSAVSAIQTLNPMDVANNADLQKQIVEAQAASTAAQVRVSAAREQTPNLQAVDLFRDVMKNIEGTENRIGTARNDFIAAMNDYNTEIRLFPGNIYAWIFGYHRRPLFVATTQATPELFKK